MIGVFPNATKPRALDFSADVLDWLSSKDHKGYVLPCVAGLLGRNKNMLALSQWSSEMKFVVVLGGDGTLLSAARAFGPKGIPLLGVNFGHFGFLTELDAENLFDSLPDFLNGLFKKDDRITIEAKVAREDQCVYRRIAVNEAAVMKGPYGRMTALTLWVSGTEVDTYYADGIIVSTPTGSTAYSLSAGGPIVAPQVEALTVTPVCAHTLYSRSMVVPFGEICRLSVHDPAGSTVLSLDGQEYFALQRGDIVSLEVSPLKVSLLRRPEWSFYEVLQKKMKEGAYRLPR